ncbi:MAG: adenylate/guanylate cyclase domain-containing protein [Myxococcales bacterium]|nr:adenylate/guanylate cyclase domain-containing protein [Myxococcales bacterium]
MSEDVSGWLLQTSAGRLEPEAFVSELGARLNLAGFSICRISAWIPTLHPELWGNQLFWDKKGPCRVVRRDHDVSSTPDYIGTPAEVIHRDRVGSLRCRLDGPRDQIPFALLRELADSGASDYFILSLDPGGDRPPWIAFTTDRRGGFEPEQVERLQALGPLLSLHFQLARASFGTRSLLEVYLGANAAGRVLAGEFRRGTGVERRAAMWFCDLRGFTELSDRLPPREVVSVLDAYFELVTSPIERHGGEILKFIGDAVLAVFPAGNDDREPCRRALLAAEEALDAVHGWSRADSARPELAIGVGLHLGVVMYGNVGGHRRLDFTVIGGSVNELCRVEALCKPLGCPLLMTDAFAAGLASDELVSLGKHLLRGVSEPREVLTTRVHSPERA